MDLDTKVTAVQHSPRHRLCKPQLLIPVAYLTQLWLNPMMCPHRLLFCLFFLHPSSIKEEQEDEEICDNYPYESPESTDEHGHSPEMNHGECNGSPERPSLHFDRVPSLWLWGPSSPLHSQAASLPACVTPKRFLKQLLYLHNQTLSSWGFFFLNIYLHFLFLSLI